MARRRKKPGECQTCPNPATTTVRMIQYGAPLLDHMRRPIPPTLYPCCAQCLVKALATGTFEEVGK